MFRRSRYQRTRRKVDRVVRDLTGRTSTLADEAQQRAVGVADSVQHGGRWLAARAEELPDQFAEVRQTTRRRVDELEPYATRARIGVLEVAQALIAVVLAVPRLVVRALSVTRVLAEQAEHAADRGHRLAERARDAAHSVEPSRRQRRRRRARETLLVGGGFGVGFVVGWIVGDARGLAAQAEVESLAQQHARHVAETDRLDSAASADPAALPTAEPTVQLGVAQQLERSRVTDEHAAADTIDGPDGQPSDPDPRGPGTRDRR